MHVSLHVGQFGMAQSVCCTAEDTVWLGACAPEQSPPACVWLQWLFVVQHSTAQDRNDWLCAFHAPLWFDLSEHAHPQAMMAARQQGQRTCATANMAMKRCAWCVCMPPRRHVSTLSAPPCLPSAFSRSSNPATPCRYTLPYTLCFIAHLLQSGTQRCARPCFKSNGTPICVRNPVRPPIYRACGKRNSCPAAPFSFTL